MDKLEFYKTITKNKDIKLTNQIKGFYRGTSKYPHAMEMAREQTLCLKLYLTQILGLRDGINEPYYAEVIHARNNTIYFCGRVVYKDDGIESDVYDWQELGPYGMYSYTILKVSEFYRESVQEDCDRMVKLVGNNVKKTFEVFVDEPEHVLVRVLWKGGTLMYRDYDGWRKVRTKEKKLPQFKPPDVYKSIPHEIPLRWGGKEEDERVLREFKERLNKSNVNEC